MSPNRIVALLTPVCALAAGWVASWIAQNFPDANISKESLQAVFIGGMAAVVVPAWQWLHGWQKYEARQAEAEQLALATDAALSTAVAASEAVSEDDELDLLEDLEDDGLEDLEELDEAFDEEPVTAGA